MKRVGRSKSIAVSGDNNIMSAKGSDVKLYNIMIVDVINKNGCYQTLNENGKKIQEKHESSMGELKGFTDRFMIFHKNGWFITESMKKIIIFMLMLLMCMQADAAASLYGKKLNGTKVMCQNSLQIDGGFNCLNTDCTMLKGEFNKWECYATIGSNWRGDVKYVAFNPVQSFNVDWNGAVSFYQYYVRLYLSKTLYSLIVWDDPSHVTKRDFDNGTSQLTAYFSQGSGGTDSLVTISVFSTSDGLYQVLIVYHGDDVDDYTLDL